MDALEQIPKHFKGRHFDHNIILLSVCWSVTYKLSSRDLVDMMAERGSSLAHTAILRWVQRFIPELEKRWRRTHRPIGHSWFIERNIY